ncbi:TetR/AcrR family transcriptional regulator [Pseudonocardia pini]|uniref:TetR/AcrR family transcriptional regulator n=1 Tax=Pseudonocardia pini TaxID=2758030 RepID=UPI0015F096EB|nr:TetR family transcriptional regulator [Pseudonocardia pini]
MTKAAAKGRAVAGTRPPGRPRKEIDPAAVAEAAGRLFSSGGYEAVSIEAVAEQLSVSRATLYRTVPTKEHLLAILFERSTQRLDEQATALVAEGREPAAELEGLVRLHVVAAIETRRYMAVFFGGAGLPGDVYERWQRFSHDFEMLWRGVVERAMAAGVLAAGDPVLTTRLVLGAVIWVSRWYRPGEDYSAEQIADAALELIAHRPG